MSTEKSTDRQHLPIDVLERLATEQPGGGPVAAETLPDIWRCLLFGLLAYQNGLIDQSVLIDALRAIARGKSGSVAETLVVQGALDASHRALIESVLVENLRLHGGDVEGSLAPMPMDGSTRDQLVALNDTGHDTTITAAGDSPRSTVLKGDGADRGLTFAAPMFAAPGERFRVLRAHARGGLGAVFVALDQELHREVALKQILDRHADDPTSRARFLIEAEITGGLEHPGIVPVYGLGIYADGRPYYAMRFIQGDSLKEAIEHFHADEPLKTDIGRRSLELRKLLRRFQDVCNAIEYAHSRGVLHRDLKPANVILGKHGETLVVDWGLAKPLGRTEPDVPGDERPLTLSSASGSAETLPGSAMGTPGYMSPEQASGELHRLGLRSDVYSLGATLYCLLTGHPPFEGDDVIAVLRAAQQGEVRPPRLIDPTLDRPLEAICLKAMARRPEDRYPRARRWPRTSRGGSPTSRSRPTPSRGPGEPVAGRGGIALWLSPRPGSWSARSSAWPSA